MPRQDSHVLPAVHIPHEQLSAVSAPSARGEPLPITAPGHVVHFALMSWELLEQSPVRGVPHRDDAIITGTDQQRPVWTPGHPAGRGWLFEGDPLAGARGHPPPPYLPPVVFPNPPPSVPTPPRPQKRRGGGVGGPPPLPPRSLGAAPHLGCI